MCKDENISLVFQGPIVQKSGNQAEANTTANCLESARRFFPNAEIILSTWKGADVSNLNYDILVSNEDPGNFIRNDGVPSNVNRQIVSTRNGLLKASRTFACKVRTDTEFINNNISNLFERFDPVAKHYRIFEHRILILEKYTRNPLRLPLLHHVSDIFQFGLRSDLLKLWDIKLAPEVYYCNWHLAKVNSSSCPLANGQVYIRYADEQYIWISFQQSVRPSSIKELDYFWQVRYRDIEPAERSMTANFYVASEEAAGIRLPKKFISHGWPETCFTQAEWKKLTATYWGPFSFLRSKVRINYVYAYAKLFHLRGAKVH